MVEKWLSIRLVSSFQSLIRGLNENFRENSHPTDNLEEATQEMKKLHLTETVSNGIDKILTNLCDAIHAPFKNPTTRPGGSKPTRAWEKCSQRTLAQKIHRTTVDSIHFH